MSEANIRNVGSGTTVQPTLRDILAPLFRRRRLVIVSFFGIFLGGILSVIVMPKKLRSTHENTDQEGARGSPIKLTRHSEPQMKFVAFCRFRC
jgi:hypothetical protein